MQQEGGFMELTEINGLSEEQIEQVKRYAQGCEDRVRTDYSKKLKDANEELAKYKPKEKSDAEKNLEERIAALETREKELNKKEKDIQIANKLKEKGIPQELASYLSIGEDIDADVEKIGTAIGSYFLDGSNKPSNHRTNQAITKSDFAKMSYSERTKLFQENNELYKILSSK